MHDLSILVIGIADLTRQAGAGPLGRPSFAPPVQAVVLAFPKQ
jgi:hypothetical protein